MNSTSILGVAAAATAMRRGEITAESYATALLERARQYAHLNSFITIDESAVLDAAREADRARAAGSTAPLLGVPFGMKDSYVTRGLRTTLGVKPLDAFVPGWDAEAVGSIKSAGGIVFGKNNLVEMSWGLTGENSAYGQVRNAIDQDRVSGGSSSGSAVSVAAGIVPASFGGDTVGSVRVPASLNGVVGFKPTTGRWPRGGVAPVSHTLDTTGLLARSVEDCVLIDQVVTGALIESRPVPSDLEGVTFAYAPHHYVGLIDPEIEAHFTKAIRRFRDAGAEVHEVDLGPDFSELAGGVTWNIFFRETYHAISEFLSQNNFPVTFDEIYHDLRAQLKEAWSFLVVPSGDGHLSDTAFDQTLWGDRQALQRRFEETFSASGADALLLPTTPALAPLITSQGKFTVAGQEVDDLFLARNTVPASGAGLPGISLPLGVSADSLPFGIELDGERGGDQQLLDIARRVESVLGTESAPA
ncbi:amidase family protein [Streptomyces sp. NBC_00988]|uniref:amidase family protein n=1 Tax=Streptomyces sp. NBC_00988 TaxID=2903704 RepID=UPI003868814A|nr:amidase family protein [Streptomyces sp. NBC_00988]